MFSKMISFVTNHFHFNSGLLVCCSSVSLNVIAELGNQFSQVFFRIPDRWGLLEDCKGRGLALTYPDGTRLHRRSSSWTWTDSQTCGASDPEKRPRTQKLGSALFRPPGFGIALKQVVLRPALQSDNLCKGLKISKRSRTICWSSRLFCSEVT